MPRLVYLSKTSRKVSVDVDFGSIRDGWEKRYTSLALDTADMRRRLVYPNERRVENWDDSRMASMKKLITFIDTRADVARVVIRLAIGAGKRVGMVVRSE